MQNELAYYAGLSGLPADRSLADHKLAYFRTQSGLPDGLSSADYERSWLSSLYGGIFLDLDTLRRHHFRTLSGLPEGLSTADYARVVFSGGGGGDVTPPTAGTLSSSNITSTTFDLTVSGASDAGGLHAQPYRFSTDNGSTWSAWQTSPVFNATGKTASTAYTCVHQTRDAAGNVSTGSSIVVNTTAGFAATFMQSAQSTLDTTSYTFAAQPIGPASATRLVVVGISGRALAGGFGAAGVTIGGIAATQLVANPATAQWAEIWCAVVPTGTTADIVVPITGGTASGCGIGVWTFPSGSPSGEVAVSNDNSAALAQSVTTLAGDVVIGVTSYRTSTSISPWITWASGDVRYDLSIDGLVRQHSGADAVAAGASVDMGLTIASFSTDSAACAAGFRA